MQIPSGRAGLLQSTAGSRLAHGKTNGERSKTEIAANEVEFLDWPKEETENYYDNVPF